MSAFTKNRIDEIISLTTKDIPEAINNGIEFDKYCQCRMALNLTVIQAVFGVELNRPDEEKSPKIRFNHRVANAADIATIAKLMDDFVRNVENPYMEVAGGYDDDMSIPNKEHFIPALPTLEKVNNKKIHDYIFGSDGGTAISKLMISGMDVVELSAVAHHVKKIKIRNTMILIGGIALVLIGGGMAVAGVYNSKKNDNVIIDDESPVVDLDTIDDDMSIENDDDAPVVEFEE